MHSLNVDIASGILDRQQTPQLSLFQATHRRHPENQQDPIRFRNLVDRLAQSLRSRYSEPEAERLPEPFRELGRESQFWNETLDGLAVLGAPGFFRVYRFARHVPERAIVADSFHLKPLLRIRQSADAYHVLALTRREMRLYEGSRDHLSEVDLVPGARTMTEALGDQRTDPHLTVASYGGAGGLAQRHGHGSAQDEIDLDTEKYFRAVDRVVLEHYSSPLKLPLILAALPEHQTPFRRVSHNRFLLQDGVLGDPAAQSPDELRARAWSAMEPRYLERLAALVETFGTSRASGRGASDPEDIAMAAVAGRIDTLLIEADRVIPGRVDANGVLSVDAALDEPDVDDVLDDLGELVLKMKGDVVVVPAERMPTDTGVAAIYRF